MGKRVMPLIWDNATWHLSKQVQQWIRDHNRQVKQTGIGVRLIVCKLPVKSPWLNAIEPKWVTRTIDKWGQPCIKSPRLRQIIPVEGCPHLSRLSLGIHAKRAVVEPERKLDAQELKTRICDYFGCPLLDPLAKNVS